MQRTREEEKEIERETNREKGSSREIDGESVKVRMRKKVMQSMQFG
jgi:hypothetical protein